jgi:hypothetical protein
MERRVEGDGLRRTWYACPNTRFRLPGLLPFLNFVQPVRRRHQNPGFYLDHPFPIRDGGASVPDRQGDRGQGRIPDTGAPSQNEREYYFSMSVNDRRGNSTGKGSGLYLVP